MSSPSQPALQHLAVIMDGNGRWAKARGLPRLEGHRRGAEAARRLVEACAERQIPTLSLYAFSAENWERPLDEVQGLMELLRFYLDKELAYLHQQGVCLKVIGDRQRLPTAIQERISAAESLTRDNRRLTLNIALSYGSRQELTHACQMLAARHASGELPLEAITPEILTQSLYTAHSPDPDLLIRTGGDMRISNFLLWQMAYTELYFTDSYWPDFTAATLDDALADYARRQRRFGRVPEVQHG